MAEDRLNAGAKSCGSYRPCGDFCRETAPRDLEFLGALPWEHFTLRRPCVVLVAQCWMGRTFVGSGNESSTLHGVVGGRVDTIARVTTITF